MSLEASRQEFLDVNDYRSFLRIYFQATRKMKGNAGSYAQFSRAAGFRSRSYPRDVVEGKRRVTAKTLPRFLTALEIPEEMREFFRLLVVLEEPNVAHENRSMEEVKARIETLRARISRRANWNGKTAVINSNEHVHEVSGLMEIYGALWKNILSEDEIAARTGFTRDNVHLCLTELARVHKAVERLPDGRWKAQTCHLAVSTFEGTGSQKDFVEALVLAQRHCKNPSAVDEHRIFASSMLMKASELPKLRSELQAAFLNIINNYEDPEGDIIAHNTCALLNTKP